MPSTVFVRMASSEYVYAEVEVHDGDAVFDLTARVACCFGVAPTRVRLYLVDRALTTCDPTAAEESVALDKPFLRSTAPLADTGVVPNSCLLASVAPAPVPVFGMTEVTRLLEKLAAGQAEMSAMQAAFETSLAGLATAQAAQLAKIASISKRKGRRGMSSISTLRRPKSKFPPLDVISEETESANGSSEGGAAESP